MKRIVFIITLVLAFSINTTAQNFTFIGENSYPSTERFVLQSNSDKEDIGDLNVVFAKDEETALVIVSSKLTDFVKIANKLIIYLDDGSVVSCTDRGINDNVDDVAPLHTALHLLGWKDEKEQHKYHSLRNCLSYMRSFQFMGGGILSIKQRHFENRFHQSC